MKKVVQVVQLVLAVAAIAALVYFGFHFIKSRTKTSAKSPVNPATGAAETEAAVPVTVAQSKRGDLPLRLTITAETEVREKAQVKSEVEGVVESIPKREGDTVAKGEVIIKLKSNDKELALSQAEGRRLKAYSQYVSQYKSNGGSAVADPGLQQAKKEYEAALESFRLGRSDRRKLEEMENRVLEKIIESGVMQEEMKRVVSELTQSEIDLQRARMDLEKTWIRAPFPGTLAALNVSVGERLSPNQDVYKIVNLSSIYLKAYILETEIAKVNPGQRVRIRFMSYPGRVLYGRVAAVSPEVDREKKTAAVFIDFTNPGDIRSGINAEADVEYEVVRQVVKIPRAALLVRSGRPLVFTVIGDENNQTANWQYVETGAMNDEEIEIKSGLEENNPVVVAGHLTLAHQARVKAIQDNETR